MALSRGLNGRHVPRGLKKDGRAERSLSAHFFTFICTCVFRSRRLSSWLPFALLLCPSFNLVVFLSPLLASLSFPMASFDLIYFILFLVLCDLDGLFGGVEAVGGSGGGDPAVDAVGVAGYAGDFSSGV